ncbi:MAG: hypothetical protein MZW92_76305 [Comamonadaceae bacterium]|nr:hypothetical protein [Comamonadaceae bacterium]
MRDSLRAAARAADRHAERARTITLGDGGRGARSADGPPMIRSENARPSGWVYVDIQRPRPRRLRAPRRSSAVARRGRRCRPATRIALVRAVRVPGARAASGCRWWCRSTLAIIFAAALPHLPQRATRRC